MCVRVPGSAPSSAAKYYLAAAGDRGRSDMKAAAHRSGGTKCPSRVTGQPRGALFLPGALISRVLWNRQFRQFWGLERFGHREGEKGQAS